MKRRLLTLLTAISLVSLTFEEDPISLLVSAFEEYTASQPVEKVYLHTDKPYYTAGESVWFKAYATMGSLELPDTLSVPLYVELIDSQAEKIVDNRIIRMVYGFAGGDFKLADSLRPGFYQLRAYTNWMKNFGESAYFTKDFQVFEFGKESIPVSVKHKDVDFQFFPEGGDLVNGINGRLAFKATDAAGKGVDVRGYIFDSVKDTVAFFESRHMGMGYVNFTPDATQEYEVKVISNNIFEQKVEFPTVKTSGYAVTIDNLSNPKNVRVFIYKTADLPVAQLGIVAQSKGTVLFSGKISTKRQVSIVEIPKADLTSGVVQITLIDENGRPHCERLVFNKPAPPIQAKFKLDKQYYAAREKVTVELDVTDETGEPLQGSFSMVVSDAQLVKHKPNAENIFTYFTLSSEVNGRIEEPGQYFDPTNTLAPINLDILLMTQGWRRFTWKELTTRQLNPPKFLAEKGLQISGKITRDDGKSLSKAIEVSMMLKTANEEVGFMVASADADGGYIFRDLNVQDSVRILLQAVAGKNGRNTAVLVDSLASPKIKIVSIPYNTIEFENEDLAEYLRRTREELAIEQKIRLNKTILLNEVVVKTKRENNYKGITLLYGIPNHTLQVAGNDLLIAYTNVFDMIGGRFAGVQGSGNSLTIRGSSVSFLLDGLAVSSDIIGSLPTSDVEKIDILKPGASTAIYGLRGGGGGIISVFTKRGFGNTDWKNVIPLGSLIFTKPGYYTAREFYSPNYAEDTPENLRPDYRSTVLWKPMVQTDEKGKATITFYTTDATTKLDIRLEGMSFTGKPVIGTYQLEVS